MKRLLILALALMPLPASADSLMPAAPYANRQLDDPAKEAEARALMETLRCVVCQSESIVDSGAEIAGDMRSLVRTRIQAGETPDQVRRWMIERYGDYISYEPGFSLSTAPLWLAPLILLGGGWMLARGRFRRRRG